MIELENRMLNDGFLDAIPTSAPEAVKRQGMPRCYVSFYFSSSKLQFLKHELGDSPCNPQHRPIVNCLHPVIHEDSG